MSTIREQIVAAAFTAISTNRPTGVPAPFRTRIDSPTPDQLPALTFYQEMEKVDHEREDRPDRRARGPLVRRSVLVHVEVLTKADATTEADKAADPLLAWASKALATAGTLGGLANDPPDELGTVFAYEQKETSFCRATTSFMYEYQSSARNPEALT